MIAGVLCALGAGLMWGLIFLVPLILGDYPPVVLAFGRYVAFGLLALGLAWFDRRALARLTRDDWTEAGRLALVGNLLYYSTLAAAIQLAGAPVPALIIGTLPVVIAITANLIEQRSGAGNSAVKWRRLALPLAIMFAGLVAVQHGPADVSDPAQARGARHVIGVLLALCALLCWTWYPLRNSRWLRSRPPGLSRAWATAQGLTTLPLAVLAALGYAVWDGLAHDAGSRYAWPFGTQPGMYIGLMVLTGLAASWLGTLLWNKASHLLPAPLVGQLIVFETLAALLYAFVWEARWPAAYEAVGIALLIGGVMLGVRIFRVPG